MQLQKKIENNEAFLTWYSWNGFRCSPGMYQEASNTYKMQIQKG